MIDYYQLAKEICIPPFLESMAYNLVPASVERVQQYLEIMKNSEGICSFQTHKPETLRYAIYEGIAAAVALKYPGYDTLKDKFTISCEEGKIVCSPTKLETLKTAALILEDVNDWMEAIGATIRNKEVKTAIIYPNLIDNDGQFKKWCEINEWNHVALPSGYKVWR
jgi:hypothetical protein